LLKVALNTYKHNPNPTMTSQAISDYSGSWEFSGDNKRQRLLWFTFLGLI